MTEPKLKPCPFCGSKNITLYEHEDFGCYIVCENCNSAMGTVNEPLDETEVIEHWNRRMESDTE